MVVNLDDASRILAVAEPFFLWLKADLELIPVMLPDDSPKPGRRSRPPHRIGVDPTRDSLAMGRTMMPWRKKRQVSERQAAS